VHELVLEAGGGEPVAQRIQLTLVGIALVDEGVAT